MTVGDRAQALRPELAHIPARITSGTALEDAQAAERLIGTLERLTETMHAVTSRHLVEQRENATERNR